MTAKQKQAAKYHSLFQLVAFQINNIKFLVEGSVTLPLSLTDFII